MLQVLELTKEERIAIYMRLTKKQIAEMLVESNMIIDYLINKGVLLGKCVEDINNKKITRQSFIVENKLESKFNINDTHTAYDLDRHGCLIKKTQL